MQGSVRVSVKVCKGVWWSERVWRVCEGVSERVRECNIVQGCVKECKFVRLCHGVYEHAMECKSV